MNIGNIIACDRADCVMCRNGNCTSLDDARFGERACPFFKTKEDIKADYIGILNRKRVPIVSAEKPRTITLAYLKSKIESLGMEV